MLIPRYRENPPTEKPGLGISMFPALALPNYPEILLPFATPGRLRRLLRAQAPDVMHIATEGPLGWAALRAARSLGLPVISSYHTNFSQYLGAYRLGFVEGPAWRYLRWFHNRTARTFCPTASIRDLLRAKGFARVGIWGRGVDGGRFHPAKRDPELRRSLGFAPEDRVFVYCGRLAAEKNLPLLMSAFRHLASPRARLLLIGDGPLREQLAAQADTRVVFTGYRQGEELARLYAAADVMTFPSLTETFGNVMLEAMAAGLPVVGFNVPGPKDVIRPGETGRLLETIDAAALAGAMAELMEDEQERRRLGVNARAYALRQNWFAINDVVRQAYQELCRERPAKPGAQSSLAPQGS